MPLCRQNSFLWGSNPYVTEKRRRADLQEARNLPLRGTFPDVVWGKQSVWLSACRFPLPQRGEPGGSPDPLITMKMEVNLSKNRKRDVTLTIRLTAAEKDAIVKNAAKARMSLTDYIVASSLLTEIHVAEDTRPLLTELKRIGNNLNQISKKVNAGAFTSYNFQEVIDLQRNIYEELYRISRGGGAA